LTAISSTSRDPLALDDLVQQNQKVARAIEDAWSVSGIPTLREYWRDQMDRRRTLLLTLRRAGRRPARVPCWARPRPLRASLRGSRARPVVPATTRQTAAELQPRKGLERFGTGVPGLDDVLLGGFFRGGVNLILGAPGSGKTILAGQIAFHHARGGGQVVYLTVLTEPHGRMVEHLRSMHFFEESLIPGSLYFVSGYRDLEKEGLPERS
jgi:KaiC protein